MKVFLIIFSILILIYFLKHKPQLIHYLWLYLLVETLFNFFKSHELYSRLTIINNFYDIFGIISILLILYNLKNLTIQFKLHLSVRLYLLFFSVFIIYAIISYLVYGIEAIKANRWHFSGQLLVLTLISFISTNFQKSFHSIYLYLKVKAILIIFMIFLRATGALPMLYGEEGYDQLRFATNEQVLSLVIFIIFYVYSNISVIKRLNFDSVLAIISFFAIITSTQRAVTFAFGLFIIYYVIIQRRVSLKLFLQIFVFGIIFIVFFNIGEIYSIVKYALYENVFKETESSTGYAKYQDIFASISYILENKLFLGRLFQSELFERHRDEFYSSSLRGIHNLFVTYFVIGGFPLIVTYLMVWFMQFKKYFMPSIRKKNQLVSIAFTCLLVTFLVCNTSGAVFSASFVIAISIYLEGTSKNRLNSEKSIYNYKRPE